MNLEFIQTYLLLYREAALLTVQLGLLGTLFATIVGAVCAIIQYYRIPLLRQIVAFYIELSRNTPLLIQLFFIYYGLPKIGISTDPATCGIAGLAFLGGSYMAETFRSGLEGVEAFRRKVPTLWVSEKRRRCGMWYFRRRLRSAFPVLWRMSSSC